MNRYQRGISCVVLSHGEHLRTTFSALIQTGVNQTINLDCYDFEQVPPLKEAVSPGSDQWNQWSTLVTRVRADEPSAAEELYLILHQSMRPSMIRRIGLPEADDRFHDMVVIVMSAIRSDSLRDSARLMGFVQTVVHRQIGASIRASIKGKRTTPEKRCTLQSGSDPEDEFSRHEEKQLAQRVLDSLSARHREIIVRFYVEEQSAAVICADMGLTETQFRLLKWRAKAQLTMRCRGKLGKTNIR